MKTELRVRLARNKDEIRQVFEIRDKVFGEEQGISRELDYDGNDKLAEQVIAYGESTPIGCARIRIIDGKGKLERIAVLKEFRGNGFGGKIVNYLVKYCKRKKLTEIYFDAQAYLENFYKEFGFEVTGKPFEEVGRPHVKMRMKLK